MMNRTHIWKLNRFQPITMALGVFGSLIRNTVRSFVCRPLSSLGIIFSAFAITVVSSLSLNANAGLRDFDPNRGILEDLEELTRRLCPSHNGSCPLKRPIDIKPSEPLPVAIPRIPDSFTPPPAETPAPKPVAVIAPRPEPIAPAVQIPARTQPRPQTPRVEPVAKLPLDSNYDNYAQHPDVRRMISSVRSAAGSSQGMCYRYVKRAMLKSMVPEYLEGVSAYQAKGKLEKYCFRNIMNSKRSGMTPRQAPVGSILVYSGDNIHGHIEIKTSPTQFCSDYCGGVRTGSLDAISGRRRTLIGIYVKPAMASGSGTNSMRCSR
jgi:hypothetical protein